MKRPEITTINPLLSLKGREPAVEQSHPHTQLQSPPHQCVPVPVIPSHGSYYVEISAASCEPIHSAQASWHSSDVSQNLTETTRSEYAEEVEFS
jgi:hypothetical protein